MPAGTPRGATEDISPFKINIVVAPAIVDLIMIARHTEVIKDEFRRWGEWELVFNGYRVSVQKDEKILEMDSGDGCTTLNILNAMDLYT